MLLSSYLNRRKPPKIKDTAVPVAGEIQPQPVSQEGERQALLSAHQATAALEAGGQSRPYTVNVPVYQYGIWKVLIKEIPDNREQQKALLLELEQSESALNYRIDSCDQTLGYSQVITVFLLGLVGVIRLVVNQATHASEADSTPANITFNAICNILPILTACIAGIAKLTRDSAINYKAQAQESIDTLETILNPQPQ